ncbi:MAG: NAD(P)-dependent oxidoreductase [Pseudomonadota bacterium]|nr:NAD(P)-dependent oxidoreductase [Pseudomonadota bacterium]
MVRILSYLNNQELIDGIHAAVPEAKVIFIDQSQPLTENLEADCLLCVASFLDGLEEVIATTKGLKWIHIFGTGIDGFPLEATGDAILTSSRGASAVQVAEWAFTCILAARKNLPENWINAPSPLWSIADNIGAVQGQTLSIFGFGSIGRELAKRALAFDMQVLATTRHSSVAMDGVETADSLEALFAKADHLVLAAPATTETDNIVNAKTLSYLKPEAHLVNIARGSLVDENDLKQALDDGKLARASLDAVKTEPLPADHWIYGHEKVFFSPHLAWCDMQVIDAISTSFLDNLALFAKQEPLNNVVDKEAGY